MVLITTWISLYQSCKINHVMTQLRTELPFTKSDNTTQNSSRMNTNSHVKLKVCCISNWSYCINHVESWSKVKSKRSFSIKLTSKVFKMVIILEDGIAFITYLPISTAQLAWSALGSGKPAKQIKFKFKIIIIYLHIISHFIHD